MIGNQFHKHASLILPLFFGLAGACRNDTVDFSPVDESQESGSYAGSANGSAGSQPLMGGSSAVPGAGQGGESGSAIMVAAGGGGRGNTTGNGGGGGIGNNDSSTGMSGSAALGGSTAMGGNSSAPVTFPCAGIQPTVATLTTFDGFTGDRWMSPGTVKGGVYVYPNSAALKAGDFLGYDGPVKTYTGIGVWFAGCINASKFRGVRFTMSGDAGGTAKVDFFATTNRNEEVDRDNKVGTCVPTDPDRPWLSCDAPVVSLPVTSTPSVYFVAWQAMQGGKPSATTDGSDLLGLQWAFQWQDGGVPYGAKLVVDDLEFWSDDAGAAGAGSAK